jgi:Schlafen, AlbA_2
MPTKSLNLSEIKSVLESGNFDEFIDSRENEFLEAKLSSAFDLSGGHTTNIKLAKYAASFANQKGGYVICGLRISRPESSPHDVVSELVLVKHEHFLGKEEIANRIAQSTYPSIRVECSWYPYAKDNSVGVGVIHVQPQQEEKKLFLIRIRELDGQVLQKELYGVPIRGDGFTNWVEVDELYRRSKAGPNTLREFFDGLSNKIDGVSNQVSQLVALGNATVSPVDDLQKKIDQT